MSAGETESVTDLSCFSQNPESKNIAVAILLGVVACVIIIWVLIVPLSNRHANTPVTRNEQLPPVIHPIVAENNESKSTDEIQVDPAIELQRQQLELERQKLALERERLEVEKMNLAFQSQQHTDNQRAKSITARDNPTPSFAETSRPLRNSPTSVTVQPSYTSRPEESPRKKELAEAISKLQSDISEVEKEGLQLVAKRESIVPDANSVFAQGLTVKSQGSQISTRLKLVEKALELRRAYLSGKQIVPDQLNIPYNAAGVNQLGSEMLSLRNELAPLVKEARELEARFLKLDGDARLLYSQIQKKYFELEAKKAKLAEAEAALRD